MCEIKDGTKVVLVHENLKFEFKVTDDSQKVLTNGKNQLENCVFDNYEDYLRWKEGGSLEPRVTALEDDVETLKGDVDTLKGELKATNTTVTQQGLHLDKHDNDIADHENRIVALEQGGGGGLPEMNNKLYPQIEWFDDLVIWRPIMDLDERKAVSLTDFIASNKAVVSYIYPQDYITIPSNCNAMMIHMYDTFASGKSYLGISVFYNPADAERGGKFTTNEKTNKAILIIWNRNDPIEPDDRHDWYVTFKTNLGRVAKVSGSTTQVPVITPFELTLPAPSTNNILVTIFIIRNTDINTMEFTKNLLLSSGYQIPVAWRYQTYTNTKEIGSVYMDKFLLTTEKTHKMA